LGAAHLLTASTLRGAQVQHRAGLGPLRSSTRLHLVHRRAAGNGSCRDAGQVGPV